MLTVKSCQNSTNIRLFISFLLLVFFLSACSSSTDNNANEANDIVAGVVVSQNFISSASWSSSRQRLLVRGNANPGDTVVSIYNASSLSLLGTTNVQSNLSWSFRKNYSLNTDVPCKVKAVTTSVTAILPVSNAPANCNAVAASPNEPPNGTIVLPTTNLFINAGESVFFSASASDPENDPITFAWDFNGGASNSTVLSPGNIVFTTPGTYNVTFTATDINGNVDPTPASRTITVGPGNTTLNRAPVPNILTPAQNITINVGDTVNFVGSATDPDGDSVTLLWNFFGLVQNSSSATPPAITFNTAGVYPVSLSAKDSRGASSTTPDVVTITVVAVQNSAPNSIISSPLNDLTINVGDSVNFKGSGFDPDGDTISYLWNFEGQFPNSTLQNPGSRTFNTAGIYHISLTVTDSHGASDPTPANRVITVNQPNRAPNGSIIKPASNMAIYAGTTLQFSATATDPDNEPVTYLWNFNGAASDVANQTASVLFDQPGNYTITLTATDARGLSDPTPDTVLISVLGVAQNSPPNGIINTPSNDLVINVGDSVQFTSTAIDPDGNIPLGYHWTFGGGAPDAFVQNPGSVKFNTAGIYQVTLTVTDSLGLADPVPATRKITVNGVQTNHAPDGQITSPTTSSIQVSIGDTIWLSGTATDPDGDAVTYYWNMDGLAPNSTKATPGNISFQSVGSYVIFLTVTDSHGMSDPTPDTLVVTVENKVLSNVAPNGFINSPVNDMIINKGDSLNFLGSGYDPDSMLPVSYLWNFDGAAPNSTQQNPGNVQFDQAGIYHVRLTVKDNQGMADASPAERVITVRDFQTGNTAPDGVIQSPATDLTIKEGDAVNFVGTATDAENNTPFIFHWSFDGGAPNSMQQSPGNVIFQNAGTYHVQLHVWDSLGLQDPQPATRTIVVEANTVNTIPPNGIIDSPTGDQVITVGDQVYFSGSGFDSSGSTPLTYRWSFDGAVPDVIAKTPGNVSFNQVGTYRIRLTVTNSAGLSDPIPAERIITVQSAQVANQAPTVTMTSPTSDQTIYAGDTVYFSATGNDSDGNYPLKYFWDMGGAAANYIGSTPGSITFSYPGVYNISVSVSDSLGLSGAQQAKRKITVLSGGVNTAPTPSIDAPTTDLTIAPGDSVNFSGSGTDAEGDYPLSYLWTFDGVTFNRSIQAPGLINFANVGVYHIHLYVTDSKGATSQTPASVTITVADNSVTGNTPPNGTITSPASDKIIKVGDYLDFTSSYYDPNGDPASAYFWDFGGATWNRTGANPGRIFFNGSGVYHIKLTVTDSKGAKDPTPSERIVTVTN